MSPAFSAADLASWCRGTWTRPLPHPVTGFAIDARRARPGDLFVALPGKSRDGHAFVAQAQAAGAAGAIVREPQPLSLPQLVVPEPQLALWDMARAHRSRFTGTLVAITGSSGKTTTKELLTAILREAFGAEAVHGTEGNLNNHLGVPLTLLKLQPGIHGWAVVEIGMNQPGEIAALTALAAPEVALITGVGPAHLEGVGELADVAREKAALARSSSIRWAAFPADCLAYADFRDLAAPAIVIEAVDAQPLPAPPPDRALFQATVVTEFRGPDSEGRQTLSVRLADHETLSLSVPSASRGVLRNLALVTAAALRLGVPGAAIATALSHPRAGHQRSDLRLLGGRPWFVDCYNANPMSMRDSLEHFQRLFPRPPRVFVLGGMKELGRYEASYHRDIGASLPGEEGDLSVFIGSEAPAYMQGFRQAHRDARALSFDDPLAARDPLHAHAGPVFLKGSRAYALERLLPADPTHSPEAAAC